MNYVLHLAVYLSIYTIIALSLNIVIGYCGLLTMAHAAYFAIGGYAYALVTLRFGWGFLEATAFGAAITATLSLALSLPAWRFKGDFFLMISLAVHALLQSSLINWSSQSSRPGTWANLTNGPFGLVGIPKPEFFAVTLGSRRALAILSGLLAVSCILVCRRLLLSPWGRLLKAMRDDELAARGLGKDTELIKVQALAVACGMVGVAGALYASYIGYIDPSAASLDESILMICMVITGGLGNLRGPLVGAVVFLIVPELLRLVHMPDSASANLRLMAYGVVLIVLAHSRPQGIAGEYRIQ